VGKELIPTHNSSLVTIRFPAYLLEKDPKKRIVVTGYSGNLAETFSRSIRGLVGSRGIVAMDNTRQAIEQWLTVAGGGLKAIGVEGSVTGFPADLIIIDDPVKNREEANSKARREAVWNWFTNDLYTRQQKDTPIILIMCLTGDTRVLMSDNTTKLIKDIQAGDSVKSWKDGELVDARVIGQKAQGKDKVFELKTPSHTIKANARHPFLVKTATGFEYVQLQNLRKGDTLLASGKLSWNNLSNSVRETKVTSITELPEEEEVYDLSIEGTENFVANGLITHNTRWHEDDLAGRLLEEDKLETDPEYKWTVISLPALCEGNDPPDYPITRTHGEALCPELHPLSQLRNLEKVVGSYFPALYQQRPAPAEGDVWKKAWFCEDGKEDKPIRRIAKFPEGFKRTQVWDTALDTKERNDYTAMVEGFNDNQGNIYVCASVNEKLEFPALITRMRTEMEKVDGPVEVCIEDKASGKPARQQLRLQGIPIIEVPSGTVDKRVRAKSVSHYGESGMITFVDLPGNCNDELIYQLLIFDNGRHDDLHDAFVHLLRRVTGRATSWDSDTIKEIMESVL
jgi:predicted phage terminase large subunit-like protein